MHYQALILKTPTSLVILMVRRTSIIGIVLVLVILAVMRVAGAVLATDVSVTLNTNVYTAESNVPQLPVTYTIQWSDSNGTSGTITITSSSYTLYVTQNTIITITVTSWSGNYYFIGIENTTDGTYRNIVKLNATSSQSFDAYFVELYSPTIINYDGCITMVVDATYNNTKPVPGEVPQYIINASDIPALILNSTNVLSNSTTSIALIKPECTVLYVKNGSSLTYIGTFNQDKIPTLYIYLTYANTGAVYWLIGNNIIEYVWPSGLIDAYLSNGSLVFGPLPDPVDATTGVLTFNIPSVGNIYVLVGWNNPGQGCIMTYNTGRYVYNKYLMPYNELDTYYIALYKHIYSETNFMSYATNYTDWYSSCIVSGVPGTALPGVFFYPLNDTPLFTMGDTIIIRNGLYIYGIPIPTPNTTLYNYVFKTYGVSSILEYFSVAPSISWLNNLAPAVVGINVTAVGGNSSVTYPLTINIYTNNITRVNGWAITYPSSGSVLGNGIVNNSLVSYSSSVPANSTVYMKLYLYPFPTPIYTTVIGPVKSASTISVYMNNMYALTAWSNKMTVTWISNQSRLLDPLLPLGNKMPSGLPFVFLVNNSAVFYIVNFTDFYVWTNGNYTVQKYQLLGANASSSIEYGYIITVSNAGWVVIYQTPGLALGRIHIWNPVHGGVTNALLLKCVNITFVPIVDDEEENYSMYWNTWNMTWFNSTSIPINWTSIINQLAGKYNMTLISMNMSNPQWWFNVTEEFWEDHENEIEEHGLNITLPQLITNAISKFTVNATASMFGLNLEDNEFELPSDVKYEVVIKILCPGFVVPFNETITNATTLSNFTIPIKIPVKVYANTTFTSKGLLVAGKVVDYFGSPASNVTVIITITPKSTTSLMGTGSGSYTYTTTTSQNGEYSYLASVPPGSYTVSVTTLGNDAYTSNSTSTTASYTPTTTTTTTPTTTALPTWVWILLMIAVLLIIIVVAYERKRKRARYYRSMSNDWV